MSKDRDIALLDDCKRGDRQALDSLVRRYERPVYNAAYRMLGNPDEAADVTQTVFLKAFENLDRFNPKFKFFSWIYRIAVNESINELKRRGRTEPLEEMPVASTRSPEELMESGRIGREIQAVLQTIQEDHRAVLVLRHFSECSYRQIGEILQIPEKTVKSRLFSARKQMKQRLKEHGVLSA
jgi:RNA polymerase sigma-70 factor (ECF subfamily)